VRSLVEIASQYNSVLDIGCGSGSTIIKIRSKIRYGIDVCDKALKVAERRNNGVEFINMDLNRVINEECDLPVVECIYGIDIVEHFPLLQSAALIQICNKTALKCLMWFIPVGHHPQSKDDRGFGNHYFQTHRSKWFPEMIAKLGYDVWYYPEWHKNIKPPKSKGAMWCLKKQD
jgi:cyclopropane fatty-acyl-phospholipid synthase-like methyltransferase